LARKRDDIAERATDWVVSTSSDLQGKRPRAETKGLVEKVIDVNLAIIEKGDREPLHAFVEYVTTLRASLEFRVSTVLRGFLSFKRGLTEVLQDERVPARDQLNTFSIVDEVYYEAIFHISDVYGAKLVHTITTRRDEIELELGQKRQELEYTAEMMQRMNDDIIALSLPILRVWKGVLLVPLIGEISQERAERTRRELLDAVVKQGVRVVLIDVTGLGVVNAQAAGILGSIMRAVSLLGAESMIVGVRGEVARVLVDIGEVFPGTRTFATLDECLRRTLRIGQTS
jgi:rsbT co-antagonist protein RsbR